MLCLVWHLARFAFKQMFNSADFKNRPGYRDVANRIVEAAESGRLSVNTPLPPSRVLAEQLGVSRDTIVRSYRYLTALGWLESHSTRGTFITRPGRLLQAMRQQRAIEPDRLSGYGRSLAHDSPMETFSTESVTNGAVPEDLLPLRRWRAMGQKCAEKISQRPVPYDEAVMGRPELRLALAAFLDHAKGIPASLEDIAVFNVSFQAVSLICRLFLEPGDVIAVEDPGFGGIHRVALYLGLEVLPVALDGEGISLDSLEHAGKKPKLVYVTPNHHEPSGVTMSLARRKQLLAWAQHNQAVIIEDDFDSNFHHGAKVPQSLKSMDTQDNVVYLGSFWQLFYPLTTLCFVVCPPSFMQILKNAKHETVSLTENLPQLILAEMLNSGYLQKYARKLERSFSARRRAFIFDLKRVFGQRIDLSSQSCGLYMMARMKGVKEAGILKAARESGLPAISTEPYYSVKARRKEGEFLIYFAARDEHSIRKVVANFASRLSAGKQERVSKSDNRQS